MGQLRDRIMKKKTLALLAVVSVLAASCSKRLEIFHTPRADETAGSEVSMIVHDIVFEDGTKVQASADEQSGLKFSWSDNDMVGVYSPAGGFSRFILSSGNGMTHATFDGQGFTLTPGNTYYALYPYDGGESTTGAIPVSYETRAISGNNKVSDILEFDPLYASATASSRGGANFNFGHLSSFARLSCTMPEAASISSVDLLPTYSEITQKGTLDISTGSFVPGATKSATSIPATGLKSTAKGQALKVWVPFAPQDFRGNDISAVMHGSDGSLYTARLDGRNMRSGTAYRWNPDMVKYSSSGSSSIEIGSGTVTNLDLDITGQFSGIAKVSDTRYAVVHDSYNGGGIVFLDFTVDSYGYLKNVSCTVPAGTSEAAGPSRGPEGIVYLPKEERFFVSGENDQRILEYDMNGRPTGRELSIPSDMNTSGAKINFGFESLAFNEKTGLIWTTTERDINRDGSYDTQGRMLLRLQSFNKETLQPGKRFFYLTDKAQTDQTKASIYAFGVPDILALDNGKLLVMEREAYIPDGDIITMGIGTVVYIKIYEVDPVNDKGGILSKRIVYSNTFYTALDYSNYEGICLGPVVGGKQKVLLISDSQDRYYGILADKLMVANISGY